MCSPLAHAQDKTLSGRWNAGPLTVKWRIGEWGTACGPKPSGGGKGGASVLVSQIGGELRITGGGDSYSTANCLETYPGLAKRGHSASSRAWSTTCKTGANDPRQATVQTNITATDDEILFSETGQYQFAVQGQNCTASSGKWRKYTLVQRAGEIGPPSTTKPPTEATPTPATQPQPTPATPTPAAPSPKPKAPPANLPALKADGVAACAEKGPLGRLEVRPSRKLMRAGESFRFRAVVADTKGCRLTLAPTWAFVSPHEGAELDASGQLTLADTAQEGELRIAVSVGGKSTEVSVEVASMERYEALLKAGSFNAAGETDTVSTVVIATASLGGDTATAEDEGKKRKNWFIIIVVAVSVILGAGGIILVRRNAKKRKHEKDAHESAVAEGLAEHERAKGEAQEAHQAALKDHADLVAKKRAEYDAKRPKLICPICGEQYPKGSKFCGKDGGTLVPLN